MGVTYKLREEVVSFIISQRQNNPLFSCRQLAELVSQQFGIRLSKSSVHDVLKESGAVTPRGRKPKDKFQIPIEKKKQIQVSLSQVMLDVRQKALPQQDSALAGHAGVTSEAGAQNFQETPLSPEKSIELTPPHVLLLEGSPLEKEGPLLQKGDIYEGAGRIFLKAALWDLGVFSENEIKENDWQYYLLYTSNIKVNLEEDKSYVIEWPLPLHRSIREVADGLINNITPLIVHKVSEETLFKASMNVNSGFKIKKISLVDGDNHIICEFSNIVEFKRNFKIINRAFVESKDRNLEERSKTLFFSQLIDNNKVMDNILNLEGFDSTNEEEKVVTLLIEDSYANKAILQQAIEKLNSMFLRDEKNRLVSVRIGLN